MARFPRDEPEEDRDGLPMWQRALLPPAAPIKEKAPLPRWFNPLEVLGRGFEQTLGTIGATITHPFRMHQMGVPVSEWLAPEHLGGRGWEEYQAWEDPQLPIGIPAWSQWGEWLGVSPGEPGYQMAQLGMKETAEIAPLFFIPGAGLGGATRAGRLPRAGEMLKPSAVPARPPRPPVAPREPVAPVARAKPPVGVVAEEKVAEPILDKLFRLMSQHKKAGRVTKAARKEEWAKRFARADAVRDRVFKKTGDMAAAMRASKAITRGPTPLRTGALGESISIREAATLRNVIGKSKKFNVPEKWRAADAFEKLLTTDAILTPSEVKLLTRIFPDIAKFNALKYSMGRGLWTTLMDIANIPRAMMSSGEISGFGRQGALLLFANPNLAWGTLKANLRTLFSPKNWREIQTFLEGRPLWRLWRETAKGYQSPEPGVRIALTAREEYFMSSIAERIPAIGKLVLASERAFTSGLNYLRYMSFEQSHRIWTKILRRELTQPEIEWMGKLINWASGRGPIPRQIAGAAPALNALMFSPRLQLSRIMLPTLIFNPAVPRIVRLEAMRTFIQFLGAGVTILSLAKLAGAEVEIDPRSSDFGKIKVGNTRLDVWAGYAQYARFMGQIVTNERKIAGRNRVQQNVGRIELLTRLFQSKASPIASIFIDLMAERTYVGEPMFEGGWETFWREARQRLGPLWWQDMWDAIEIEGLMGGAAALPGVLGIGVVTYPERKGWPSDFPGLPEFKLPELP